MTNFNYLARDASGALQKGSLKAADRSAALQALKAQGFVPVSVVEGAAPRESLRLNIPPRTLLLAGVVLVLLVGLLFVLPGRKSESRERRPAVKKAVKVDKVAPAPSVIKATPKPVAVEPPTPVAGVPPRPVEFQGLALPATTTLGLRKPPKADNVIVPGIVNNDTNAPDPYATFKTKSERIMSHMLSAKPEDLILDLSMGRNFDQDFIDSLANTIEIYPTDTEEMASHKESVAWMKDEMRKLVKAGQSPEAILTTFRIEHNEVANFRSELQSQLSVLKKEGKVDEAEAFVREANKMLEPYGTKPLVAFPVFQLKKPLQ